MVDDDDSNFVFYHYKLSLVAAIIFVTLFGLLSSLHSMRMINTRTWFFTPFVLGGFAETIGYVGRILSSNETPNWTTRPYTMQSILLLVAPALFAATIYMELGRIIEVTDGESRSTIRRPWRTKISVCGDVISFFMQGGGGGIMASGSESSRKTGQWVIIGGLSVQVLFFSMFIVTATVFHSRILKRPTEKVLGLQYVPWREHMLVLYLGSISILVRSVFRVVEYVDGQDGYLVPHEWCLYVFDGMLMVFVMAVFVWRYPGEIDALLKKPVRTRRTRTSSSKHYVCFQCLNFNGTVFRTETIQERAPRRDYNCDLSSTPCLFVFS